jgi:hypothetical protein
VSLEAANVAFTDRVTSPPENLLTTLSWLSMDIPTDGTAIAPGYVEDTARIRDVTPGVPQERDTSRAYGATYPIKTRALTMSLPRLVVKGDRSGRTAAALSAFGQRDIMEVKVWEAILANTILGVDGVPLFSTTHPHGPSGNQGNATSAALTRPAFVAARAAQRALRKENGSYLDVQSDVLFVGPLLEETALELVNADRSKGLNNTGAEATSGVVTSSAIRNVYEGLVRVVVTPLITGTQWYLADATNPAQRGFCHGMLGGLEVITPTADDADCKDLDILTWQVKADIAFGPANWQRIYGGGLSL